MPAKIMLVWRLMRWLVPATMELDLSMELEHDASICHMALGEN